MLTFIFITLYTFLLFKNLTLSIFVTEINDKVRYIVPENTLAK